LLPFGEFANFTFALWEKSEQKRGGERWKQSTYGLIICSQSLLTFHYGNFFSNPQWKKFMEWEEEKFPYDEWKLRKNNFKSHFNQVKVENSFKWSLKENLNRDKYL
jgi:hypothetical protein